MTEIVGVRFKRAGKIYYFDPEGAQIEKGTKVIVETSRGVELGEVVLPNRFVSDEEISVPLKRLIRIATSEDFITNDENKKFEKLAFSTCIEKINMLELEMKLVYCEVTFDKSRIIFYFTALGRVDFRALVKELSHSFRSRIELRQIGVRDESKALNSIAICGRELCCSTYLADFHPVSIKMAKEQNMSLNPTKISGICGRLMCCLKYEEKAYEHLLRALPNVGSIVKTPEGEGEVIDLGVIKQLVKVLIKSGEREISTISTFHVDEIQVLRESHNQHGARSKKRGNPKAAERREESSSAASKRNKEQE